MRSVVACQVPEVSARAYIDPGLGDGHDETAFSISQVAPQHDKIVIVTFFFALFVSAATVLGQDIVTGNTQCRIPVLHQRGYIRGTLEHNLYISNAANACRVLGQTPADGVLLEFV